MGSKLQIEALPSYWPKAWGLVNLYLIFLQFPFRYELYADTGYFFSKWAIFEPTKISVDIFFFLWIWYSAVLLYHKKLVSLVALWICNWLAMRHAFPAVSGADQLIRCLAPFFVFHEFLRIRIVSILLIKIQITLVYFFALTNRHGNTEWVDGSFMWSFLDSLYARWPVEIGSMALSGVLTYGLLCSEICIMIGLWFRHTRWIAFSLGLLLFIPMLIFTRITDFPWVMIFCNGLFFDNSEVSLVGMHLGNIRLKLEALGLKLVGWKIRGPKCKR